MMERKWMVLASGDIRGFGTWTYRASNSLEIQAPFIQSFYDAMQQFVRARPHLYFKYLGDGMMIGQEMSPSERRNGPLVEFLQDIQELTRRMCSIVAGCEWPAPDGFRMRIMAGYVHKIMVLDPTDPKRKRFIPEYVGYLANTVARLQEVNPATTCLVHENVVRPLLAKASMFDITKFETPREHPRGVNQEDLNALHVLGL
jgi:class 3 adenylate cyclase